MHPFNGSRAQWVLYHQQNLLIRGKVRNRCRECVCVSTHPIGEALTEISPANRIQLDLLVVFCILLHRSWVNLKDESLVSGLSGAVTLNLNPFLNQTSMKESRIPSNTWTNVNSQLSPGKNVKAPLDNLVYNKASVTPSLTSVEVQILETFLHCCLALNSSFSDTQKSLDARMNISLWLSKCTLQISICGLLSNISLHSYFKIKLWKMKWFNYEKNGLSQADGAKRTQSCR